MTDESILSQVTLTKINHHPIIVYEGKTGNYYNFSFINFINVELDNNFWRNTGLCKICYLPNLSNADTISAQKLPQLPQPKASKASTAAKERTNNLTSFITTPWRSLSQTLTL